VPFPSVALLLNFSSVLEVIMSSNGEVTIEHGGKHYGATYTIENGMLHVKTYTETRSFEVSDQDPALLARSVLLEIVTAQPNN
jgi:hypothetical protein